jgi:hypothetical protein
MSFDFCSILFNLNSNTRDGNGAGYTNTRCNTIMSNHESNSLYIDTETDKGIRNYESCFTIEDIFNWK